MILEKKSKGILFLRMHYSSTKMHIAAKVQLQPVIPPPLLIYLHWRTLKGNTIINLSTMNNTRIMKDLINNFLRNSPDFMVICLFV